MAAREVRASPRRLLLLTASVAVGVAALVAINSFTANLRDSVRRQAQGTARRRPLPREPATVARGRRAADRHAGEPRREGSAGHQLLRDGLRPPHRWHPPGAGGGDPGRLSVLRRDQDRSRVRLVRAATRPPCGGGSGTARGAPVARGGYARAGRGAVRHHRNGRERARQRGPSRRVRAAGLHPRALPPGDRTARLRCAGGVRGLPAVAGEHRRAADRQRARAVAARRAGSGAHGRGRPRAAQRDPVAAHRLSRPRRPHRAPARRDRRGERGGRLHPPAHGHDRGAPLPRRHRRARARRCTGPRPRGWHSREACSGRSPACSSSRPCPGSSRICCRWTSRPRSRGARSPSAWGWGSGWPRCSRSFRCSRSGGCRPSPRYEGDYETESRPRDPWRWLVALALAASTVALASLQVGSGRQGAIFAGRRRGRATGALGLVVGAGPRRASLASGRSALPLAPGPLQPAPPVESDRHRGARDRLRRLPSRNADPGPVQPAGPAAAHRWAGPAQPGAVRHPARSASRRWSDRSARRASRRRTRCRSCRCASRR